MAVRYVCDRCGETDQANSGDYGKTVGRFSLSPAVSQPHKTGDLPKFDSELCGVCLDQVCVLIHAAFKSKRT